MLQTNSTRLPEIAFAYTQLLSIPVTQTKLKQSLEENTYYPSLYSMGEVFNRLNIPNQSVRINPDVLPELEPPFIAYMNEQEYGTDFVLVKKITGTHVRYTADGTTNKTISIEGFKKLWQNIVFVAERAENSGDKEYAASIKQEQQQKRKKQWQLASAAAMVIAILLFYFSESAAVVFSTAVVVCIKAAGIAVTSLLLMYDLDRNNSLVKNICTAGKQVNCDAVLRSKGAKLLGITWSEIGFFYFAATSLLLLFPGLPTVQKTTSLGITSSLSVPFIFYSVFYQWRVVKQWCPLCLTVITVLLAELVWSAATFWQHPAWPALSVQWVCAMVLACLLPVTAWYIIKPLLLEKKAAQQYRNGYKRLLYNPDIFNGLLQHQRAAAPGYQQLGITLGNPGAAHHIIKVCNPYCGPCAQAHPKLEALLHRNPNVNLKIIFTATNNENDKAGKVVKHLMAIAAKGDAALTAKALDDWYLAPKKDYDAFAAQYPMNGELKQQDEKINAMSDWCREAAIQYTPTLFINERQLPETYQINELEYFL